MSKLRPVKKKLSQEEKRKIRDVADYIYDCTNRLFGHAELLAYFKKHYPNTFADTQKLNPIILSMSDVYSRDVVITLGHLLDQDANTSSLFTFVDYVQDDKKKKRFRARLIRIKERLKSTTRLRANQVAHFNSGQNVYEKGLHQVRVPFMANPVFLKDITKKIEVLYFDIKEALPIDGQFMSWHGSPVDAFAELVKGPKPTRRIPKELRDTKKI